MLCIQHFTYNPKINKQQSYSTNNPQFYESEMCLPRRNWVPDLSIKEFVQETCKYADVNEIISGKVRSETGAMP